MTNDDSDLRAWLHGVGSSEAAASALLSTADDTAGGDGATRSLFLSVLVYTRGRQVQELREVLLSLAGQDCDDFEVLVVAHALTSSDLTAVQEIVDEQPGFLRPRVRLIEVESGNRAAALNAGLGQARGRYFSVLRDEGLVLGGWVAEFIAHEQKHPGRILRVVTMRQDAVAVDVRGLSGVKSAGPPQACHSEQFSLLDHLSAAETPSIGIAFPRRLHTHFGLAYDESRGTHEDQDFLLRSAQVAGVTDIDKTLAIDHRWLDGGASRVLHSDAEREADRKAIQRRIDDHPILLPARDARRLRDAQTRASAAEARSSQQQIDLDLANGRLTHAEQEVARLTKDLRRQSARVEKLRGRVGSLKEELKSQRQREGRRSSAGSPGGARVDPAPPARSKAYRALRRVGRGLKRRLG